MSCEGRRKVAREGRELGGLMSCEGRRRVRRFHEL